MTTTTGRPRGSPACPRQQATATFTEPVLGQVTRGTAPPTVTDACPPPSNGWLATFPHGVPEAPREQAWTRPRATVRGSRPGLAGPHPPAARGARPARPGFAGRTGEWVSFQEAARIREYEMGTGEAREENGSLRTRRTTRQSRAGGSRVSEMPVGEREGKTPSSVIKK